MIAISGTRRSMKEMSDGTIRLSVDIDPACRAAFFANFPNIDMPIAIAPLVADFERRQEQVEEQVNKGGALAKLAGMWCNDPKFWGWAQTEFGISVYHSSEAAEFIRSHCGVESRAELDHDAAAAKRFNDGIRIPFAEWLKANA